MFVKIILEKMLLFAERIMHMGAKGDVFNLGELGGCIDLVLYNKVNMNSSSKVKYYCIPPNSWKLLVLGSGQVKKDTQYLLTVYDKTGEKV